MIRRRRMVWILKNIQKYGVRVYLILKNFNFESSKVNDLTNSKIYKSVSFN